MSLCQKPVGFALLKEVTVKDYLTVKTEGEREVQRKISLYNLD